MKELYVCEKCGATYEEYNKAYECEHSHLEPYTGYMPEVENRKKYDKGMERPKLIAVPFRRWAEDHEVYEYSWYKKAADFSEKEFAEINAERETREVKEKEDRERWYAEREARKAREAQAAQEAQEQPEAVGA